MRTRQSSTFSPGVTRDGLHSRRPFHRSATRCRTVQPTKQASKRIASSLDKTIGRQRMTPDEGLALMQSHKLLDGDWLCCRLNTYHAVCIRETIEPISSTGTSTTQTSAQGRSAAVIFISIYYLALTSPDPVQQPRASLLEFTGVWTVCVCMIVKCGL